MQSDIYCYNMFREIRRKDRVWEEAGAIELSEKGEYGFLSMVGTDGYGYGILQMDLPEEERMHALRLLADKYCPEFKEMGEKYIKGSFHRTNLLRMDIEHISGKCKRIK